jgi:hypothetical protein
MARDENTAKFAATITVELEAVNKYGDRVGGGNITYTKTVEVKNMVELGVYLERLNDKPFEYVQMVDPPSPESDDEIPTFL